MFSKHFTTKTNTLLINVMSDFNLLYHSSGIRAGGVCPLEVSWQTKREWGLMGNALSFIQYFAIAG